MVGAGVTRVGDRNLALIYFAKYLIKGQNLDKRSFFCRFSPLLDKKGAQIEKLLLDSVNLDDTPVKT